jgi:hypothetical protein
MENATEEIVTLSTMIIPIHLGVGTRVKVAVGFSRKTPMVATSQGAYGYAVGNGVEMSIAKSPEQFAAACVQTIRDSVVSAALAKRG